MTQWHESGRYEAPYFAQTRSTIVPGQDYFEERYRPQGVDRPGICRNRSRRCTPEQASEGRPCYLSPNGRIRPDSDIQKSAPFDI